MDLFRRKSSSGFIQELSIRHISLIYRNKDVSKLIFTFYRTYLLSQKGIFDFLITKNFLQLTYMSTLIFFGNKVLYLIKKHVFLSELTYFVNIECKYLNVGIPICNNF